MRKLSVFIEIDGRSKYVGDLLGEDSNDMCFSYAESYINDSDSRAISISLPLNEKSFNATRTRNYFEGLLPEGFTRKCVAQKIHVDENDYISILAKLGSECLGAIKIVDELEKPVLSQYRELSTDEVYALAAEGASESADLVTKSHLSLTGASGKVGLYYDENQRKWYLPIGEAPSTHIVKQSHVRLKRIVTNEQLCLMTAKNLGIDVPESFVVTTATDDSESVLFATRRYDRVFSDNNKILKGMPVPNRLHQEDLAQALGIAAFNKYEKNNDAYLKKVFDLIRQYSSNPIEDSLKLWDICIFNYLIGNTDNHIKNLSLLYSSDLKSIRLAPAYDIVSTMIYVTSSEDMAISIGGVYNIGKITRECFAKEAAHIGLGKNLAMQKFDDMKARFPEALQLAKADLINQGFTQAEEVCDLILKRSPV